MGGRAAEQVKITQPSFEVLEGLGFKSLRTGPGLLEHWYGKRGWADKVITFC
jgi:hypothetical protein